MQQQRLARPLRSTAVEPGGTDVFDTADASDGAHPLEEVIMTTFGRQHYWNEDPYDAQYRSFSDVALDVTPRDRVGSPLPSRFKARIRRTLMGIILAAGAWMLVANDPDGVHGVVASARSLFDMAVSAVHDIAERAEQNRSASLATAPSAPVAPAGPITPIEDHQADTGDITPAAGEAVATESLGAAYAEPSEPAQDTEDKSTKRKDAIAAGLSPDLPNILLSRLSDADLKNARYAITTALAKTPDDGSFAWPPKPNRQQALFEVRFVQGAAQGCRRYIVTVTKDRWSSTSAALEKCGGAPSPAG
jgi:surface antigen